MGRNQCTTLQGIRVKTYVTLCYPVGNNYIFSEWSLGFMSIGLLGFVAKHLSPTNTRQIYFIIFLFIMTMAQELPALNGHMVVHTFTFIFNWRLFSFYQSAEYKICSHTFSLTLPFSTLVHSLNS